MSFKLKSFPQIMRDMISAFLANSPINDFNKGSVISTLLEAAATEDFQQYYQCLSIISNFTLDNVTGQDLDNRALEYGLDGRIQAKKSTGQVTISDTAFSKISTKLYAGLSGPVTGQNVIYVDNATSFTASGSIIIGRGTVNAETISYSSITTSVNYSTINLSSNLARDHGTDETVILAQGGNRVIATGIIVKVPASDFSSDISFTTNFEVTIQDGEDSVTGVDITAVVEGSGGNVPAGSINTFDSKPFPTALVTNFNSLNNGVDLETDEQLRNRIKDTIQSLSKGTKRSVVTGVVGIVEPSDNKRVVSANLIETTSVNDISRLVIDDGTGFEPSFLGRGYEELVPKATGGEEFLQIDLFPMVKAIVVTINSEPFSILNGMTLIYEVSGIEETVTFQNSDFRVSESGTAQEVVTAINNRATLIEARTTEGRKKIELRAKVNVNESVQITGGTANAANILNFPSNKFETLKLYKFNGSSLQILEKDGTTATLKNTINAPYNFSGSPKFLDISLDGEILHNGVAEAGSGLNTIVDSTLGDRFLADADLSNKYITFLTGANTGLSAPISSYNFSTDTITLTGGLTVSTNDTYSVDAVIRIFFSHISNRDFLTPNTATASEVSIAINKVVRDIASLTGSNNRILLTSKLGDSSHSKIKIYGGTANAVLGFPLTASAGTNKDYTLNRFNGQIQLESPLNNGDLISSGTRLSRGFIATTLQQPFNLLNGDTISVSIDGGSPQVITFLSADFSNISTAVTAEVIAILNRDLLGATAFATPDNKILLRTNTFAEGSGSVLITAVTGNAINLGFSVNSLRSNIKPHIASLVSGSGIPFNFVEEDHLVIILDNDIIRKTFDLRMDLGGTIVSTASPLINFTAKLSSLNQNFTNKFLLNDDLKDFKIVWKTASNPANIGQTRTISSYNAGTGLFTLNAVMPANITATDTFVVIPVTIKNIVTYINNTSTSTFSINGIAEASNNGTRIQLSTLTDGGSGYVNVAGGAANALNNLLYQDGSGNDIYVESSLWKPGMDISVIDNNSVATVTTIISVTPNNPIQGVYRLTTGASMTGYTLSQNASVTRLNTLNFSTVAVQGVDGYKYYTGLLKRVQRTVDGLESDQAFPGLKAAGVQIEVLPPTVQQLKFEIDVQLAEGITISAVVDDVKNAISSYVNSTKVGEDIILNKIVDRVMAISGIVDMTITSPTANVPIADGELARVSENEIVVG